MYKNFKINDPAIEKYFDTREDISVEENVFDKDEGFWNEARHEKLSENEEKIYTMIDTLKDLPVVKTYVQLVNIIATGYKVWGPIEIGNIFTFVNFNEIEGPRFKFGLQTSNDFSKRLLLGAYVAYGIKDQEFKYAGNFLYLLTKKPRQSLSGSYRFDLTNTSDVDENFGQGGLLTNIILRRKAEGEKIPIKLLKVREAKLFYEKEWIVGFSTKVGVLNRRSDPYFNFRYKVEPENINGDTLINSVTSTEFSVSARFAYQEKFISGEFNRISLGSKRPIVRLKYSLGIKNMVQSDFHFHRIDLTVFDKIPINPIGKLRYILQVGKVFGTVPYLLMEIHDGNEGFFSSSYRFSMMNEYEFASDFYTTLFLQHHFDGFLFDKIPGVRKLKLRAFVSGKALFGRMSEKNLKANRYNLEGNSQDGDIVAIKTANRVPYVEVAVGIENILKILKAEVVWRLTHKRTNTHNFGFRFGAELSF